jgi:hypothetical protein
MQKAAGVRICHAGSNFGSEFTFCKLFSIVSDKQTSTIKNQGKAGYKQ